MLSCQLGTPLGLTTGCTHSNDAGVNCGELHSLFINGGTIVTKGPHKYVA